MAGQDHRAHLDHERLYQTIINGAPIVITFEDEAEANFLNDLVTIMLERRCRSHAAAVLH